MKVYFLSSLLMLSMSTSHAQDLLETLGKSAFNMAGEKGTRMRAALDSVDFQFSISVNESAGFFDISQRGETGAKLLYGFKEESTKSMVEKIRDTLEVGIGMYDIRRYKKARETILKAKDLMESNGLTHEIVYLRILTNLGVIDLAQGKTAEAEKYIMMSLKKSEMQLGKSSAAYIANLNNFAKLHQAQGKYTLAEKEFEESLTLAGPIFGDGMQKAIILNNKAMLFQALGRTPDAVSMMNQAIELSSIAPKKIFQGKRSFDNRKFQANLAFIYQLSGDYDKAESNMVAIKDVFEGKAQTSSVEYAGLLNQLAVLYMQMEKMDKVEALLKKSKEIYLTRFKTEINPYFARATSDLGNYYRMSGQWAEAEKELAKAMGIREAWLGTSHPDYVKSREDYAILLWKTNRIREAYPIYLEVMNKTLNFIDNYFPAMSESEKTSYWDLTSPRFQRYFNLVLEASATVNSAPKDMLEFQMSTKALLLNSTNKAKTSILQSGNERLKNDYNSWIDKKEELARFYSYSKKKLKDEGVDLNALEASANTLEKNLSEQSSLFSSSYLVDHPSCHQLDEVLTSEDALVDIVRIRQFTHRLTDEIIYAALVLKKGMTAPTLIKLEKGAQLETTGIKGYRTAIKYQTPDGTSYNLFWQKINEEVKDKKRIYFSPDGVYNQINPNTLKDPSGNYLINAYEFIGLGNSKDVIALRNSKSQTSAKTGTLIGFADFSGSNFESLPGTKIEIEEISLLLKGQGYTAQTLEQKEATENNIKSLQSPSLLHVATHGYFQKEITKNDAAEFGVNADNAIDNPLLRSGLVFSGARSADLLETDDMDGNNDGFLTAYEAMNLNLDKTELVILSACETALGEIKAGEGVYGLQRAFVVAGAKTLIMSLWKVDDTATKQLMIAFYQNWFKSGDKRASFRQAQLQLLNSTNFKEPYFWGAFVITGL